MFHFGRKIYADNNATTPVGKQARKAMTAVLTGLQANPSTPYRDGRLAAEVLDAARRDLGAVLNVPPGTIVFTSGATESNNHVRAIAPLLPPDKRLIVHSPMEHPAMLEPLRLLEKEGFVLVAAKPDRQGRIGVPDIREVWDDRVGLLVMMAANNETGTLYDVAGFAKFARARGALLFSDMVQALGKTPVDLRALGVDYASFSAHKIRGPKGVGALYVRDGAPYAPFMAGGGQEDGRRAGTEALHNIAGFAAAAREVPGMLAGGGRLRELRDLFVRGLREIMPEAAVNSPLGTDCQPGTVSLTLPGHDNAFLLGQLDFHGISVAAGSACATGANEPSHVLLAMGLSPVEARSTLRLSFGHDFSVRDLDYLLQVFKIVLKGDEKNEIGVVRPAELTDAFLSQKDLAVVHIKRFPRLPGPTPLPGSRVVALGDRKAWDDLEVPRKLLLTCEVGYDAPIIGWSLRKRGVRNISVLALGLWGLKLARPDLWARLSAMREEEEKRAAEGA
ncbi:MAG: cysteine desulfurase, partial [Deltaproteobacteria bacterium]|nr:cysteine desulfurase [Deltaproteobacteria bacterium]